MIRHIVTLLHVWRLKRRARALLIANRREMTATGCGFALRDDALLVLCRREDEAIDLARQAAQLEATL